MMQVINPFILSGYVSPDYFCDRKQETAQLVADLRNGRNVTLISPRRMGKTGLIRHVFHEMGKAKDTLCYYVDLYQTDSLASLVKKLGDEVLGNLDTTEAKIVKRVSTSFKSLRPVISIDPMTGTPSFSIDIQPALAERSLAEIFDYMQQGGKRCYVAFDEFQTVTEYADKNVEALLRAHIQHLTNVHFIFSGSQRHVLENMFVSASRPFYQSTQMMNLACISPQAYEAFAQEKLSGHGQQMAPGAFDHLYQALAGHTWYVQMALNRLYELGKAQLTADDVDLMLRTIVAENEATYHTFLHLITPAQGRLLRAVAHEGTAREILGQTFITTYRLGATSTIKSATKVLVDKELLLQDDDAYQVYDRFFAIWLSQS